MERTHWDAIVVGGGPAGLSAALVLGRCRRRVLVCDAGEPRNRHATELHGFLTRDGLPPARFLELSRESLASYTQVEVRRCTVADVKVADRGFTVELEGGERLSCRKVLLATGVRDVLPELPGIEAFYGHSVHHCPYCDGWEARDQPVAVYGRRQRAYEMARALTAWTNDLVVCSDGPSGLRAQWKTELARNGIRLVEDPIASLEGHGQQLETIVFRSGRRLARRRLFFDVPADAQSKLPRRLGCRIRNGSVHCSGYEAADVPGVFIAGNLAGDVQLVIFAAAEGAKAAFGINRSLTREDFEWQASGRRIVEHPAGDDPDQKA